MKRLTSLAVLMAMMLMSMTAVAQSKWMQNAPAIKVHNQRSNSSVFVAGEGLRTINYAPKAETIGQPSDTTVSSGYGFLVGPDGNDWVYTEEARFNGTDGYKSAAFTLYDAAHKNQGTIEVTIPEGRWINAIEPYGIITNKFFDRDASTYEVLVYIHEVLSPGVTESYIGVYNTKGDSVTTFRGSQAAIFHVQQNSWTSYDRMLLVSLEEEAIETENGMEYNAYQRVDIYKPVGWGDTNEIEHTIRVNEANIMAVVGSWFNTYEIDNEPYYMVSSYEKPFYNGEWDYNTGYQYPTDNNSFKATLYNKNLEVVNEITFPCEDMNDKAYKVYGCGFLTYDDVSKGMFTGDDQFNYIITADTYDFQNDEDKFDFFVYDSKGQIVKTIDTNVDGEGIAVLADIEGQERQLALGHTETDADGNLSSYIKLINIPSCEISATVSHSVDMPVSFNMNRAPRGDSYEYAISYNDAEYDADGNVYAIIGWFTKDLKFSRKVRFNIGKEGLIANPLLTETSLNPYLFNTNIENEYIYLWSVARNDGTEQKDWHLCIADGDGNPIRDYVGNDSKGGVLMVGMMNARNSHASLYIDYYNQNNYQHTIEYIPLPLVKFEKGGSGTKEDPYLVATFGDLEQIANSPLSHYKQVRHIDMSFGGEAWTPIDRFQGTYDGGNYRISNLLIDETGGDELALFAEVTDSAKISNVFFENPTIYVGDYNYYAAVLAGNMMLSSIENVHVSGGQIICNSEDATPYVGGLAAYVAYYSDVNSCSFDGIIDVPNGNKVGGIAGEAATATPISVCTFTGLINGGESVGGILGSQGDGSKVLNCHVNGTIKGKNTVGGLVGDNNSRAVIANNYVEGSVENTELGPWGAYTGGLVGSLSGDFSGGETKVIYNNVINLDALTFIQDTENNTVDNTIHAVIGKSIEDEDPDGNEPFKELGLEKNYVTFQVTIGDSTLVGTHDNLGGELVTEANLNKAFFEGLGFAFGEEIAAPWVDVEDGIIALFIEDANPVVGVDNVTIDTHNRNDIRKVFENGQIVIVKTNANGVIERYAIDGRRL